MTQQGNSYRVAIHSCNVIHISNTLHALFAQRERGGGVSEREWDSILTAIIPKLVRWLQEHTASLSV